MTQRIPGDCPRLRFGHTYSDIACVISFTYGIIIIISIIIIVVISQVVNATDDEC